MDNEKLFEFMTKMYNDFSKRFENMNNDFSKRFEDMDNEIAKINKTVIKIENEHGEKLDALFDGYKQNSDKLDRIESEISKHENFILKRIK